MINPKIQENFLSLSPSDFTLKLISLINLSYILLDCPLIIPYIDADLPS
jgi:hypothetical protein